MAAAVHEGARVGSAARPVVRRRAAERMRELRRPPHPRTARRNKAAIIWEGEPGDRRTLTYFDLYRQVSAFANVLKSLRRDEGRPRRHLPAAHPGARDRHARVRPHRRGAQRRVRRLQRRIAPRPHQRSESAAPHHRRRRVSARPGRPAEACRRRGGPADALDRARRSWCSAGTVAVRRGIVGGPRPLVPRV